MKDPFIFPPSGNPRVPPVTAEYHHVLPLQLRFNDMDMLGHLNNGVYINLFDLGKSRYFQDVATERVEWNKINIVVVNINCDFFAPTFIDEPVAVATTTLRLGEKSLTMEQRIFNTATGEVKCVGRTVMAGIDLTTGRSAAITPEWVDALCRYEGRDLTLDRK